MAAQTSPQIVVYEYAFSPFGQKILLALAATGTSFVRCDVPAVLPRPQLEALDITYRRIPVAAIGKDVFCDSGLIIDALVELEYTEGSSRDQGLALSKSDKAYEAWGRSVFNDSLPLVPPQALSPEFVKDRETIFPILRRPDLSDLRPSALGAFRSAMATVEDEFLAGEHPWIAGEKIGLADVHVAFVIRWVLQSMGIAQEKGFGKEDFPRLWEWLDSLPKPTAEHVDADEAKKMILGAEYVMPDVQTSDDDSLKSLVGKSVTVENADADVGAHIQAGKLLGCNTHRIVVGLDNGLRLHFPKAGYVVKPAKA